MVPVSQARALDKKLTELGVKHTYEEHSGGHVFLPEKSLAFLVENLSSAEASPAASLPAQAEQILRYVASILSRLRFSMGAQS